MTIDDRKKYLTGRQSYAKQLNADRHDEGGRFRELGFAPTSTMRRIRAAAQEYKTQFASLHSRSSYI